MDIILPKLEKREFIGNILKNDVKFVGIQDKELDTSRVVVSVNIGSLNDPHEYEGLAHFLEHMLFLGSEKYPGENEFEKFLNENGGYSNAYTDTFETVYYFTVLNKGLRKAMDMFSRFFIDPLFDQNSVDREIKAIESEHNKNIQQDIWRLFHFIGLTSKDKSMINKFGTGNLDSLNKPGIREEMISFYKKYYVSKNINVVVISSLHLNTINQYVNETFINIPKKEKIKMSIDKPFYENKNQSYFLKSISKKQSLIYYWEIPSHVTNYLNSHSDYILLHVISSDNENSLKQFLISKGLIKDLYCIIKEEGIFIVDFELSKLSNWKKVDSYFRFYITSLINNSWDKITNYYQKKDKLLFDYSAKIGSDDLGTKLATNMSYYTVENSFIGSNVISKINVSEIESLLTEYLTFDRVNIIITANEFSETDFDIKEFETEPYYNLEFAKIKLKPNELKEFKYEIVDSNSFLDIEPKVYPDKSKNIIPSPVNGNKSIWFGNVFKFGESRVYCVLSFSNLDFIYSISNFLSTEIFIKYVNKKIEKLFYLASEIGFHTYLSLNEDTSILNISIYGYNDKFNEYFNNVVDYIKNFSFKEEDRIIVETIFDEMKDNYMNINKLNPWNYRKYVESLNVNNYYYSIEKVLTFLKSFSVDNFISKLNETKNRIIFESKFTSLFYGNIPEEKLFGENLNLFFKSIEKPKNRLSLIPNIDVKHPNSDEKNNYVQFTYYIGEFVPLDNLILLVLTMSFSQKFFDVLRTKKQFGYLVSASRQRKQDNYYFVERIQSEKSIKEIDEAIQDFNNTFLDTITEEEFIKFVETTKKLLEEKENSTRELYSKYADEIVEGKYLFNRDELLLKQIPNLTFKMYKEFYLKKILKSKQTKIYIRSQN